MALSPNTSHDSYISYVIFATLNVSPIMFQQVVACQVGWPTVLIIEYRHYLRHANTNSLAGCRSPVWLPRRHVVYRHRHNTLVIDTVPLLV